MELVIAGLTHEAQDVLGLELRAPDGGDLPVFTAGAHVDLHLPGGLCRQYSLTNSPHERDRYVLGVGLATPSRGGSSFVHTTLVEGDVVEVGEPRALFSLDESAGEHVFIAGGIGITPILSMNRWCETAGRPWRLLYCVRNRARAAYAWTLAGFGDRVRLHVDEEAQGRLPDLAGWVKATGGNGHVYCCGPEGLMDAVDAVAAQTGLPKASVHFERFNAPTADPGLAPAGGFTAVLKRSGQRIDVSPDQSLLEALEEAGLELPYGCREGLCRSCELGLLEGEADHRDHVLSDDERASGRCILPCVSRAKSQLIVLDL